jgi:hypothetical protein
MIPAALAFSSAPIPQELALVPPPPVTATLTEPAHQYHAAGLYPIRIKPNSKIPLDTNWTTDRHDADDLAAMFAQHKGNIGVTFPPDVFALDIDCKGDVDGRASFAACEFQYGALPPTRTQETPSGGRHMLYRLPPGVTLTNKVCIAPGLDIRTAGGQIVVAPSVVNGKAYRWLNPEAPIADIPPAWLPLLRGAGQAPAAKVPLAGTEGDIIPEGARNDTLHDRAATMRRAGFEAEEISGAIRAMNERCCSPPLPDSEVDTIVVSAARYQADPEPWQVGFGQAPLPPGALPVPPARFKLLTPADLAKLPPVQWRVRGVLPSEGIGAVFGPSGSGKSFLVLDQLAAVAAGREWFGCRVTQSPVLYVALEGEAGIAQRVKAYETKHGGLPESFRFLLQSLDIRNVADRAALVQAIQAAGYQGGVLAIDTLNRAAPGMDENDSKSMGEVIGAAKAIQAQLGGLVLLVHHTGKDATKGLRGHSSLHAALDAAIEVTREGAGRVWTLHKAKDGEDGGAHLFGLDVVGIGTDDEGAPITSCVVAPEESAGDAMRRTLPPKSGNQKLIWEVLAPLLRVTCVFGSRQGMKLEEAIEKVRGHLVCDPKRQTERTQTAISGLVQRGLLKFKDDWIWLA